MDNAQKAIMIGVGLFITIIVIAAVMAITGIGQDLLNKGQGQLAGISGQLEQQMNSEFNNVNMSGAQVLAAINRYYNNGELVVFLYNGSTDTQPTDIANGTVNGITAATPTLDQTNHKLATKVTVNSAAKQVERTDIKMYTTNGDNSQIISSARYKSVLVYSANDAVMGIAFLRL
ncbi:MAG: hypothetical protein RSF67_09465 [Clostridia bacterium]